MGLVYPARFIPVLEDTSMIIAVGEWVLRAVCEQANAWREAGLPPLRVAVNISARQFKRNDLVSSISAILHETGANPDCLELELTESLLLEDASVYGAVLHDLKALGVSLSIDDFGTGYSSLSYLKRFPVDYLKIDQSFIRDTDNDPDDATIVTAIIGLAHNLRLRVIAEGVEGEQQLAYLRDQGCDIAQGHFLDRPLPTDHMTRLLQNRKPYQVNP